MENLIKEKRIEFDLTQEELADLLQVSRQTIISLERGRYNPSIVLAFKISKLFKCTVDEVFIFEEVKYEEEK